MYLPRQLVVYYEIVNYNIIFIRIKILHWTSVKTKLKFGLSAYKKIISQLLS